MLKAKAPDDSSLDTKAGLVVPKVPDTSNDDKNCAKRKAVVGTSWING